MFVLAADDPLSHVLDKYAVKVGDVPLVTMHMVTLLAATLLLFWMLHRAAGAIATGPASAGNERYLTHGRLGQIVELMTVYLRDEMLEPVMGRDDTRRYLPYLLTLFFFILVNNLLGLIPLLDIQHLFGLEQTWIGGTATGNINITAGLAAISFLVILVHGFRQLGMRGFMDHMTGGLAHEHWTLWAIIPLIFVVEVAGLFIKPAALAIRLFANMIAGHTLMAVLLGFGAMAAAAGLGRLGIAGVTILSGVSAVLIMFLELFVAVLQAFIFMFLTAVFISLVSSHDDHGETEPHGEPAAAH